MSMFWKNKIMSWISVGQIYSTSFSTRKRTTHCITLKRKDREGRERRKEREKKRGREGGKEGDKEEGRKEKKDRKTELKFIFLIWLTSNSQNNLKTCLLKNENAFTPNTAKYFLFPPTLSLYRTLTLSHLQASACCAQEMWPIKPKVRP